MAPVYRWCTALTLVTNIIICNYIQTPCTASLPWQHGICVTRQNKLCSHMWSQQAPVCQSCPHFHYVGSQEETKQKPGQHSFHSSGMPEESDIMAAVNFYYIAPKTSRACKNFQSGGGGGGNQLLPYPFMQAIIIFSL